MQQSYNARLQDSVNKAHDLSQDLTAAQHLASILELSLGRAESSCRQAEEGALQLRGQLQDAKSAAQSACSTAQHLEAELLQLQEQLNEQACASRAAAAELETRIADMGSARAAQQAENAVLHATIQAYLLPCDTLQHHLYSGKCFQQANHNNVICHTGKPCTQLQTSAVASHKWTPHRRAFAEATVTAQEQCFERVKLQRQLSGTHSPTLQSDTLEDRHSSAARPAYESANSKQGVTDTEVRSLPVPTPAYVIQRRMSSLRGGAYAGMRPGMARQWQK